MFLLESSMCSSIKETKMEWHTVYDLSKDYVRVMQIQKASLETEEYGFLPEIAAFGSIEWWKAVGDGRIPRFETTGVITRVNDASRGAWPVCEVSSDGGKTEWTRYGEDELYQVGRRICIEYVYQRGKNSKTWKCVDDCQRVVLNVAIKY